MRKDKGNMFAGSEIEHSETAEHAAIRAAFKELSVHVKLKNLITTVSFNGTQFYYSAQIIGGKFGTSWRRIHKFSN
ncbi:hypothetical protein JFL43_07185 [Viridibacillus sp. YIM B01967]|uniref:Uncharacterized protein n=1 Tax=Viridibacillus soli TaxID=2798301 RepID=A0ABS1H5G6_9BACL|nr:hypothetical protein [Viridibacillus soli]MBK3494641.1 hypothetical protein [Viridibacillus soli]